MLTIVPGKVSYLVSNAAKGYAELICAQHAELAMGDVLDEWPELYRDVPAHPCQHGAIADRLIEAACNHDVVVTTHSEIICLRIRRRIAEGKLDLAAVRFVWVEAPARSKLITFDEAGFTDWWPKGVFSEDFKEVCAMNKAQKARGIVPVRGEVRGSTGGT